MMKLAVVLAFLLLFAGGCSTVQNPSPAPTANAANTTHALSGIQELALTEQDLQQLGLASDLNVQDLQQLGITGNGTNCQTDEHYTNIVDSSQGQYNLCVYTIPLLNNTQVIIELQRFADYEALNGSYQYGSSHLYGANGLISENAYGDQSRFRVNSPDDYGGQFNDPNVFYYHLWICKDLFLIHITSSGSKEAKGPIAAIGRQILKKFG